MRSRQIGAALSALAVVAVMVAPGCFSERAAATAPTGSLDGSCRIAVGSPIIGSTVALVAIQNFGFHPDTIRVRPGTTVSWVNCESDGVDAHTSTSDDDEWESPFLEPGATYSFTFTRAGRYDYHCLPHPFMRGVVVVE